MVEKSSSETWAWIWFWRIDKNKVSENWGKENSSEITTKILVLERNGKKYDFDENNHRK